MSNIPALYDKPILEKLLLELEHPTSHRNYCAADKTIQQIFTSWVNDFLLRFNECNTNIFRVMHAQYNVFPRSVSIHEYYGLIPSGEDPVRITIFNKIEQLTYHRVPLNQVLVAANDFIIQRIEARKTGVRYFYPGYLLIDAHTMNLSFRHDISLYKLCEKMYDCFAHSSVRYKVIPPLTLVEGFLAEVDLTVKLAEFFGELKF